ncbi:MAG: hypothetical protein P8O16_17765 [Algoriphagus sp.]|uniref:hypothetical protein n=1 Tax=Algoriphagus sp. TaxID=1872435 RepID=UPI002622D6DE|nr:hypothetical protein [Algoriphagus sp.]MDG1279130.1 hypothetical protein [Algoriphagus sp.]
MSKRANSDSVFTPELIRIIKIFGAVSLGLVLMLSFFNERRANNTGQDQTFVMTSANRMYFQNVKAIQYDMEVRRDAGMTVYRHKKLTPEANNSNISIMIILNPSKDEAYIYLEPIKLNWPITLRIISNEKSKTYTFENGNKSDHLHYFQLLKPAIEAGNLIEIQTGSGWNPIWSTPKEKEALNAILEDFQNLTD